MNLEQVTTPTALPVTLKSLKDHLRIESNETAYDSDLAELQGAAVDYLQAECHVCLITTQWRAKWDCFPSGNILKIPLWPVATVDSLAYVDSGGAAQTWASSNYQTDLIQAPAEVCLAPTIAAWPITQIGKRNAVTLTFTAGYGTDANAIPHRFRHAIRLLVAHWFKNREGVITGTISKELEFSLDALLKLSRVNEFEEFIRQ